MKVINTLIDSILSYIIYCIPKCENFEELKCSFRIDIDNKNSKEIKKILQIKYNELYNFLHKELSNLNFNDYKILFNKIKNTYQLLSISQQYKNFIYDKLLKLYYCLLSDNNGNLIFIIKEDFISIISTIIFYFIKKHIIKYLEIIKFLNDIKKKERNISKLIHMKNNILELILKNICPLLLSFNKVHNDKYDYNNIYNINECLKNEIFNIKAGATKYNSETIQSMLSALENINDSDNTLYDKDKVNEFINFLKDPNTKKLIGETDNIPYSFDDTINKINVNTLNNEGYVSLNIFNELMDTDIGHKLLKVFTGKTPDEISGIIFKAEDFANNGDILEDNSFGFKKGDVVLISVLECLDALKKGYNNSCTTNTLPVGSVTVNINTPISDIKINDTFMELEPKDIE
ncbi:unknown similar to AMEV214 [Choristoneura biennis entomopoxvirus]|uniref:Uncharacterized protein n=1 Tax=Choristoneura biennis entomopoxvirus TaxID=10288 RepID=A0A916P169_CBEPV|nr:unknown similar to AMEV214 [Choristoneura biennis entomopoxvirus]CCU55816.1 unknown similar to AMEV214 [Choristoneura biennis entomopoxvirus]